jgi:hypothetical protein
VAYSLLLERQNRELRYPADVSHLIRTGRELYYCCTLRLFDAGYREGVLTYNFRPRSHCHGLYPERLFLKHRSIIDVIKRFALGIQFAANVSIQLPGLPTILRTAKSRLDHLYGMP